MIFALASLFILPAWPKHADASATMPLDGAVHRECRQKCVRLHPRDADEPPAQRGSAARHARGRTGNEVAIASGYTYPRNARVTVTVGRTVLPFQGEGTAAYASNGPAAVAAFRRGSEALARGPRRAGQRGTVTDAFSLSGFTAAYNAISRECPAPRRRH